jgi:hypothetical protein
MEKVWAEIPPIMKQVGQRKKLESCVSSVSQNLASRLLYTYTSSTSTKRKCGIACQTRVSWRRNPHSSFSRNRAVPEEMKGQPMKMGQSV